MADDLQFRLVSAFPPSADANLIRSFREGILIADSLLDSEPFLQTAIGRDLRGYLRRAAILFRLDEMCRVGDLPFEAVVDRMRRGNWHWLEIKSGNFVAHVCRTEGPLSFPDDTLSRQDDRLRNQGDLFEPNIVPWADLVDSIPEMCVWLTFGGGIAGQLQHLCWAIPSADGSEWLAHINVLKRAAASGVYSEGAAKVSKSISLRFKEHIEEAISAGLAPQQKR